MAKGLTEKTVMGALDWSYDAALEGLPGLSTAEEMAGNYLAGNGNLQQKASSLVRWQAAKAGTSGFLTGLGGLPAMLISIPANIISVVYVQTRMVAAIACMGGYDLRDDRVKTFVFICLAGNTAKDVIKDTGIVIGTKLSFQAIKAISGKTLTAINRRVGFRLLTKLGSKGAINLGKAVPIIGGVIGGSVDGLATRAVGKIAVRFFIGVGSQEDNAM